MVDKLRRALEREEEVKRKIREKDAQRAAHRAALDAAAKLKEDRQKADARRREVKINDSISRARELEAKRRLEKARHPAKRTTKPKKVHLLPKTRF